MDESIMSTKTEKRGDKCLIYYFQDKLDLPEMLFEVLNKAVEIQKLYGVTSSRLNTEYKLKYDRDLQSHLGNKNIVEKCVIDNNKDILCRVVQTEFQFIQKLMLLTYATGDQILKYVEDRQNDLSDNYEVWKFQVQDLYLITLSHRRYLIVQVDTSEYIDELNVNNYQAVQQFMREFYDISQSDQIKYEIDCILSDSNIQFIQEQQFDKIYQIDVNDLLLHQDLKDYINEKLLMAPLFNKDTLSFDWNNQNKINLKKLPSEGIQQQ